MPTGEKRRESREFLAAQGKGIRVDASEKLTCHAGTDEPMFPTQTVLVAKLNKDTYGLNGVKFNVDRVALQAGVGDLCGNFAQYLNQPGPHRITLTGTRKVIERYRKEFRNKCGRYFEETLDVNIAGTTVALRGWILIGLEFVPMERCE